MSIYIYIYIDMEMSSTSPSATAEFCQAERNRLGAQLHIFTVEVRPALQPGRHQSQVQDSQGRPEYFEIILNSTKLLHKVLVGPIPFRLSKLCLCLLLGSRLHPDVRISPSSVFSHGLGRGPIFSSDNCLQYG